MPCFFANIICISLLIFGIGYGKNVYSSGAELTGSVSIAHNKWTYPTLIGAESDYRQYEAVANASWHFTSSTGANLKFDIDGSVSRYSDSLARDSETSRNVLVNDLWFAKKNSDSGNSVRVGWQYLYDERGFWWSDTMAGITISRTTGSGEWRLIAALQDQLIDADLSGVDPDNSNLWLLSEWVKLFKGKNRILLHSVIKRALDYKEGGQLSVWAGGLVDYSVIQSELESLNIQSLIAASFNSAYNRHSNGGAFLELGGVWSRATPRVPTVELYYTFASGAHSYSDSNNDPEVSAGTEISDASGGGFQQTGLHDNYSRYGDLLLPSLTNLQILSAVMSLQLDDNFQLSLAAHHFRKARKSSAFSANDLGLTSSNGRSAIGIETGIGLYYTPDKNTSAYVTCSYFSPGVAIDDRDQQAANVCSAGVTRYF